MILDIIAYLNDITSGLVKQKDRGYNGMSSIGEGCYRKLQYNMYMASGEPVFDARIIRLFNDGHAFEPKFKKILEDKGIEVLGLQDTYVCENEMWFGHSDLFIIWSGHKYLFELKTHNDKYFQSVKKKGVQKGYPKHYDQMTMYMGYGRYTECVYAACNKDDSDLHFEMVKFDPKHFAKLKEKSVAIIATDTLFPRVGNNSESWFECKLCHHSRVCHGRVAPDKNCRTCVHVEVHNGNKWACNNELIPELNLDLDVQKSGCHLHEYSAMFS